MSLKKKDFTLDEIDVIRYLFDEMYSRLEYDGNRKRFISKGEADIELTHEEYSNYQIVMQKIGLTVY